MDFPGIYKSFKDYCKKNDTDVFIYSGPIAYTPAAEFIDKLCKRQKVGENCLLFLTTPGGDPHAAYRMIRSLRRRYKTVKLGVAGPCKSAGTLISLGVHEIIMSDTGELGPLDVQLAKPDEIISSSSGLDIIEALAVTTESAFNALEQRMLDLVEHSGGAISTKTAAEIASSFAVELFKPIMAQIEPDRLGEVQRAIKIAHAYGEKLGMKNLRSNSMQKLVDGYPSHGFVIDLEEAKTLYQNVRPLEGFEVEIADIFRGVLRHVRPTTQHFDVDEALAKQAGADRGASPTRQRRQSDISPRDGEGATDSGSEKPSGKRRPAKSRSARRTPEPPAAAVASAQAKKALNGRAPRNSN